MQQIINVQLLLDLETTFDVVNVRCFVLSFSADCSEHELISSDLIGEQCNKVGEGEAD
jgi:hypothetical protein